MVLGTRLFEAQDFVGAHAVKAAEGDEMAHREFIDALLVTGIDLLGCV